MAINANQRNDYLGNGVASTFPYTFKIFAETDLLVVTRDTNGNESTLNWPGQFSVSGVGVAAGGSITLTAGALTSGWNLAIKRVRPYTQVTTLSNQSAYQADTHESTFDALAMLAQQLQDITNRTLRVSEGLPLSAYGLVLPPPVANQALGWDPTGKIITNIAVGVNVPSSMDAPNVTFLQAGSGAVQRTVRDALRDRRTAKDFGAAADDTQDDAPKINQAIASSTNGEAILPPGTYKCLSTISFAGKQVALKGSGRGGTILHFPNTGVDGITPSDGSSISHLTLRGPNSSSAGNAGVDGSCNDFRIDDCIIEKWGDHGVNTGGGSLRWKFTNVILQNNINDGVLLGAGTTYCQFTNCHGLANGANGFDCNGSHNTFTNCVAKDNGPGGGPIDKFGFVVYAGLGVDASYNSFIGCRAITNGAQGFIVKSSLGLNADHNSFSNCYSIGNTGGSGNGDGFCVDGSGAGNITGTRISNCFAIGNQRNGVQVDGSVGTTADTIVEHCTLLTNGANPIVDSGTRTSDWLNKKNLTDNFAHFDVTGGVGIAGAFFQVGTNPAASGAIRIPNNTIVSARNAANGADLALVQANGSDVIIFGQAGKAAAFPGGMYLGAATGGNKGDGTVNATAYYANGTGGGSGTISVRKGDDSAPCNLVFAVGILTSTTC